MRFNNSKDTPPAEDILDAAVDAGQLKTTGQPSINNCLQAALGAVRLGSLTIVVELGPETQRVLADLKRIADHFDPPPSDIVDTPYIANRLGLTTARIAQLVRSGEIPKACVVPGSGNGRLWKFYRRRMEEWLAKRE
jgi:hypothetical protein